MWLLIIRNDTEKAEILSRAELVIQTVLLTAIIFLNVLRFCWPFIHNPLDWLFSDPSRHFNNGFDTKCEDLCTMLNAPGYEFYLQSIFRFTYKDHTLVALCCGLLSISTPYFWYRWMRELTRDKTISLLGYALLSYLPSWNHVYGFFFDTTLLLPLIGAGLWLTWRAERKGTWGPCLLAASVCGMACCTKASAIPMLVIPWFWVAYKFAPRLGKMKAAKIAATCLIIMGCFYGLGPLKVYTHCGAAVLLPDGLFNKVYFECGKKEIMLTSWYFRDGGVFCQVNGWGSTSPSYPPFYPFSKWKTVRQGQYKFVVDYTHGRDYTVPINMSLRDRLYFTFENIIFFFFEYQWPEDSNWDAPFPLNADTMVRFICLPMFIFMLIATIRAGKRQTFMNIYFMIVTMVFMFQQTCIMEGRYKKPWDGFAIVAVLSVVANSNRFKLWRQKQMQEVAAMQQFAAMQASLPVEPKNGSGEIITETAEPREETTAQTSDLQPKVPATDHTSASAEEQLEKEDNA